MRKRIAIEAARIITEERLADFYKAKHKAAERLGAGNTRNLPRNDEIEAALAEYQLLFRRHAQPAILLHLRRIALVLMEYFSEFKPRLTGAVLRGTADEHSEIELHLFAETPEEIRLFLLERHLSFEPGEQRVTLADGTRVFYPSYRFQAEDAPVRLTVFPMQGLRQSSRSEVNAGLTPRASIAEVKMLVEKEEANPSSMS